MSIDLSGEKLFAKVFFIMFMIHLVINSKRISEGKSFKKKALRTLLEISYKSRNNENIKINGNNGQSKTLHNPQNFTKYNIIL